MNGLAAEVTASAATVQQAVDLPAALDKFHTFYSTAFEHLLSTFSTGVTWVLGVLALVGVVIPIISAWRQNAREAEFDKKLAASGKEIGTIRDQLLTKIDARESEFEKKLAEAEKEINAVRDQLLAKIAEVERDAESAAQARIAELTVRLATAESKAKADLRRQVCYLKAITFVARAESMATAGNHAAVAHSAAASIREMVDGGRADMLFGPIQMLAHAAKLVQNPKGDLDVDVIQNLNKSLAKLSRLPDGGGASADKLRHALDYIQQRLKEP